MISAGWGSHLLTIFTPRPAFSNMETVAEWRDLCWASKVACNQGEAWRRAKPPNCMSSTALCFSPLLWKVFWRTHTSSSLEQYGYNLYSWSFFLEENKCRLFPCPFLSLSLHVKDKQSAQYEYYITWYIYMIWSYSLRNTLWKHKDIYYCI